MTNLNKSISFLFATAAKSAGIFAALILIINSVAYLSGVVSTGFYEENFSLFQQSAFSIEGLALSNQLGAVGFIVLLVLTFIAVLAYELKAQRSENDLSF